MHETIKKSIFEYKIKIGVTYQVKNKTTKNLFQDFGLLVEGPESRIQSISLTPDQKYLVLDSLDGTIRVWDFKQKSQEKILKGHEKSINCLVTSKDSKMTMINNEMIVLECLYKRTRGGY